MLDLTYELELAFDDGHAELRAVESMPLSVASVSATGGLIATLHSIICSLVDELLQDVWVGLTYSPSAHARRYAETPGAAVKFEQSWYWLSMSSRHLERPMALADPATM